MSRAVGERQLDRKLSARAACRLEVESAVERCNSHSDPDEPEPAVRFSRLRETAPVILDPECHGSLVADESDTHCLRVGMLDDVRQSLLRDLCGLELRGQSHASRKIDLQLDLEYAPHFQAAAQVFEGCRETKLGGCPRTGLSRVNGADVNRKEREPGRGSANGCRRRSGCSQWA